MTRYADDYRKQLFQWSGRYGEPFIAVWRVGKLPLVAEVSADQGYAGESLSLSADACEEFAAKLIEAARVIRRHSLGGT